MEKLNLKRIIKKYNLQVEALTLMHNYFRKYGLSRRDKLLFKGMQRYLDKILKGNLTPSIGDVVITKQNIEYYRNKYRIRQ